MEQVQMRSEISSCFPAGILIPFFTQATKTGPTFRPFSSSTHFWNSHGTHNDLKWFRERSRGTNIDVTVALTLPAYLDAAFVDDAGDDFPLHPARDANALLHVPHNYALRSVNILLRMSWVPEAGIVSIEDVPPASYHRFLAVDPAGEEIPAAVFVTYLQYWRSFFLMKRTEPTNSLQPGESLAIGSRTGGHLTGQNGSNRKTAEIPKILVSPREELGILGE